MKAWVMHGFDDMRLEEVPKPVLREGWVLVRLEVFQPSVTEVMRFKGVGVEGLDKVKRALEERGPSQLLGHEFCGRVVETSSSVATVRVGDRVSLAAAHGPCGLCQPCRQGRVSECKNKLWIGMDYPGCFAEYVAVPEVMVKRVLPTLSANEAACLQPLATVVSAVDRARISIGDTVAVLGMGVMGASAAQIARACGAGRLIVSDINKQNLELAEKIGVDVTVDAKKEDIVEVVKQETGGRGVDIVFECAGGNPAQGLAGGKTLGQAFEIAGKGASVIQLAHVMPGNTVPFELKTLRKKSIAYMAHMPPTDKHFYYGVDLIATKRIDVATTITHVLDGIEKLPEAFEITGNKGRYNAINPAQVLVWKE